MTTKTPRVNPDGFPDEDLLGMMRALDAAGAADLDQPMRERLRRLVEAVWVDRINGLQTKRERGGSTTEPSREHWKAALLALAVHERDPLRGTNEEAPTKRLVQAAAPRAEGRRWKRIERNFEKLKRAWREVNDGAATELDAEPMVKKVLLQWRLPEGLINWALDNLEERRRPFVRRP